MIKGFNLIGSKESIEGDQILKAYSPVLNEFLTENFFCATSDEVAAALQLAQKAFETYKHIHPEKKALFLDRIASCIEARREQLVNRAYLE